MQKIAPEDNKKIISPLKKSKTFFILFIFHPFFNITLEIISKEITPKKNPKSL